MAWPYDARYFDFAAGGPVPAAALNEIQDQIIAHSEDFWIDASGFSWSWAPVSAVPEWSSSVGTIGDYQEHVTDDGNAVLLIKFPCRAGMIVKEAAIKFYKASSGTISMQLRAVDKEYDSPTTPPSNTLLGDLTPSVAVTGWSVETLTGLSHSVDDDESIIIECQTAAATDYIAGARLLVQMIS